MKMRKITAVAAVTVFCMESFVIPSTKAEYKIDTEKNVISYKCNEQPPHSEISFSVPKINRCIGGDMSQVIPTAEFGTISADKSTPVLPSSYDMRKYGGITSVKNQSGHGTCWAHSSAAAAESDILSRMPTVDLSELHTAFYTYNSCEQYDTGIYDMDDLLDYGGNSSSVVNFWSQWLGPVFEKSAPYNDLDSLNFPMYEYRNTSLAEFHLENAVMLDYDDERSNTAQINSLIKQIIMDGHAVDATYISNSQKYYDSYYYTTNSRKKPRFANHAIAIAGWDDNFPASKFRVKPEGNGAWLAKNSWGSDYGDDGYIWISYYDTSLGEFTTYDMGDKDNYDTIYQHDSFVPVQSLSASDIEDEDPGGIPSYMANVFSTAEAQQIEAVSTYIMNPDTDYEITVYTDLEDPNVPTSGTPSSVTSGRSELTGYFTFKLDEPVVVGENTSFSVAVKLTSSESSYVIPIETSIYCQEYETQKITDIGSYTTYEGIKAYSHDGESFFSTDGTNWDMVSKADYRYDDDEKEVLLESFIEQLYDGVEEEDEKRNADLQVDYYKSLFKSGDIGIVMGNINLKAFGNKVEKVHFSHESGSVPLNESVELTAYGSYNIYYSENGGELVQYTEPVKIESETEIYAVSDNGAEAVRRYTPAKAELFSLGYDTGLTYYKPVLKYAQKDDSGNYVIELPITAKSIRFFPISDCEVIMDGKRIENYAVTESYEIGIGTKEISLSLKKENALDSDVKIIINKLPVEFDNEHETVKISGKNAVYAPDGTRLVTGSSVSAYAGQNLVVSTSEGEIEVPVPERNEIPDMKIDFVNETLTGAEKYADKLRYKTGVSGTRGFAELGERLLSDGSIRIIPNETITFKIEADEKHFASLPETLTIPAAPDPPSKNPDYSEKDGVISLIGEGWEYAEINNTSEAFDINENAHAMGYEEYEEYRSLLLERYGVKSEESLPANVFTDSKKIVSAQPYLLRYKAAKDKFASKSIIVTFYLMGDANGNGKVDAVDASLVLTHYARVSTNSEGLISENLMRYCDFNKDGTIDARDASAILTYYAKQSVL